jgi:hypothetical protein
MVQRIASRQRAAKTGVEVMNTIFADFRRFSPIFADFRRFSPIFADFRRFSPIFGKQIGVFLISQCYALT